MTFYKKLTLMQEFNVAVSNSVVYKKNLTNIGDFKFYYSAEYGEKIVSFLKHNRVDSKETDKGSLMSASSSARLCTNYFYDDVKKESFEFEKPLYNDVSSAPTKMDAVDGLTFYECKCQEIVNGEHELLRKSYYTKKSSKLFKDFSISNIKIRPHFNKYGKQDFEYLEFNLIDLGINYHGKYHDINFNVKQLICHLIAIANQTSDEEQKNLVYLIFRPKKEIINQSESLKDLYKKLDEQFDAILKSEKIQAFISPKRHNINLSMKYISIDEVHDYFGN